MDINPSVFAHMMTSSLPIGINHLEQVIDQRFKLLGSLPEEEYETLLFEHATHVLCAVNNALITLSHTNHVHNGSQQTVNVTSNGIAGLLRVSLEGMALFFWLSEVKEPSVLRARGFGIHFKQVEEASKYYKQIGDMDATEKFTELFKVELAFGIENNFLRERKDKPGRFECVGEAQVPDATSLCTKIQIPPEIVSPEIVAIYNGISNAGFLYRWLSGSSHGMYWVNSFENGPDGKQQSKVVYWLFNLALGTILQKALLLDV